MAWTCSAGEIARQLVPDTSYRIRLIIYVHDTFQYVPKNSNVGRGPYRKITRNSCDSAEKKLFETA